VADTPQLTLESLDATRARVPSGIWASLAHQEQLFVAGYLLTLNQTKAARLAAFPTRRLRQAGHEQMQKPHVRAAVEAAMAERADKAAVDAERVLEEVDTVALSCVTDYRMTEDGYVEPAEGRSPEVMRAIKSIKRRVRFVKNATGDVDREIETEFTLWDKPGTLRLSMQHRGMLVEKHEVTLPPGSGVLAVPVAPDAAQWGAMAAAQQDALQGTKDAAP
jgi:phage terminase small subunit